MELFWKKEPPVFCRRCGTVAVHNVRREITGGQWAGLAVALICFVIPGVIYGIHLATGGGARKRYRCPSCGAMGMWVPVDSPVAQMEMAALRAGTMMAPPLMPEGGTIDKP
jgi:hypothetical protein